MTDEDRRDLLKALGIAGTGAIGGLTLEEVHRATTTDAVVETRELAAISEAVSAEVAGPVDTSRLVSQQDALASTTGVLARSPERGFPAETPRKELAAVATAGRHGRPHIGPAGHVGRPCRGQAVRRRHGQQRGATRLRSRIRGGRAVVDGDARGDRHAGVDADGLAD